jgi:hypothetical protein
MAIGGGIVLARGSPAQAITRSPYHRHADPGKLRSSSPFFPE